MQARSFACVAVLLAGSLSGRPATAQETGPLTQGRINLGPLNVAPTLELRDAGLDTNVYNQSIQEPIKDFAFTVVPAFQATLGLRRVSASVRSATDLVYFMEQKSERSVNEDLSTSVRLTLHRVSPYAEVGYLNTRERIINGEVDARARHIEWRSAAGVDVTLTPKLSGQLHTDFVRLAFDKRTAIDNVGLAQELNRHAQTFAGGISYALTPLTSVVTSVETSSIKFTLLEPQLRDTDTKQVFAGVRFSPRALITGTARIGYHQFRPINPVIPVFNGIIGSAALAYRLRTSTTLGLDFDRHTDFSYLADEPYYIRQAFGLSLRRQLPRQWLVDLSAVRATHRYQPIIVRTVNPIVGHTETLISVIFGVGYDVNRRTRVTTRLAYQDRRSDFAVRGYDGFRVGTSIAYAF